MFRLGHILLVCLTCSAFTKSQDPFPFDIERCLYSDNECIRRVVTNVLQTRFNGHPGLGLSPFDPLPIENMVWEKIPGGPVELGFQFRNIVFTGINQGTITNVSGFTKKASDLVYEMDVIYPCLMVSGPYSVEGQVFGNQVTGSGYGRISFEELRIDVTVPCTSRIENGKAYLSIVDVLINFQPRRVVFELDNLFDGDEERSLQMNALMNQHWEAVFAAIKPSVDSSFAEIADQAVSPVYAKFPYDDLFLPSFKDY